MPLSEEELRMLEQMERALVAEDPKFASALRGSRMRSHARRRVLVAAAGFVVGVVLLMAGVVVPVIPVGILGFVVMLGTAVYGLTAARARTNAPAAPATESDDPFSGLTVVDGGRRPRRGSGSRGGRGSGSFMERMEQRWRRRREGGQGY